MRTAFLVAALVPAAALAQIAPGQWDMTTTISQMEMPDVPPAIANMMKSRAIRTKHCITPEQAKLGPQEAMKSDKSCRFTNYSAAGGRIRSTMVCDRGGQTMTTTSSGSFTANGFTATGTSVGTGASPMRMTSTTIGKRTGDCK